MGKNRNRDRRVTSDNSNRRLPVTVLNTPSLTSQPLRLYEDRRYWHPEGKTYAPARSFSQSRHRLRVFEQRTNQLQRRNTRVSSTNYMRAMWQSVPHQIGFVRPNRVLICARRQIRKQVLFASRKTGKRGQRRPRFNWYSKIRCR